MLNGRHVGIGAVGPMARNQWVKKPAASSSRDDVFLLRSPRRSPDGVRSAGGRGLGCPHSAELARHVTCRHHEPRHDSSDVSRLRLVGHDVLRSSRVANSRNASPGRPWTTNPPFSTGSSRWTRCDRMPQPRSASAACPGRRSHAARRKLFGSLRYGRSQGASTSHWWPIFPGRATPQGPRAPCRCRAAANYSLCITLPSVALRRRADCRPPSPAVPTIAAGSCLGSPPRAKCHDKTAAPQRHHGRCCRPGAALQTVGTPFSRGPSGRRGPLFVRRHSAICPSGAYLLGKRVGPHVRPRHAALSTNARWVRWLAVAAKQQR